MLTNPVQSRRLSLKHSSILNWTPGLTYGKCNQSDNVLHITMRSQSGQISFIFQNMFSVLTIYSEILHNLTNFDLNMNEEKL